MLKVLVALLAIVVLLSQATLSSGGFEEGEKALAAGDCKTAVKELKEAALKKNCNAQYFLGMMYLLGKKERKEDVFGIGSPYFGKFDYVEEKQQCVIYSVKESKKWLQKAAEQGSEEAAEQFGEILAEEKHHSEAKKWILIAASVFRKRAEEGDAYSQYKIASMYARGWPVLKDCSERLYFLTQAAEKGNVDASVALSYFYRYSAGRGVNYRGAGSDCIPYDFKLAVKYAKLVMDGVILSYTLSSLHDIPSDGTPKEYKIFMEFCRPAAEDGDPKAQICVAKLYLDGLGVPQNSAESFRWYLKAAEQGDGEAQCLLGMQYRYKGNYIQAHKWLNLAVSSGDAAAKIHDPALYRKDLEEQMTERQIAEAQRLALEWRPKLAYQ